jgi:shikimate kinase
MKQMHFKNPAVREYMKVPKSEPAANIYLTGFMGAGKSSAGRLLAARLGVDFYDTDEVIARALEMSIGQIFSCFGETFFRDAETELLGLLAGKLPGTCVVATGGGAVLREENMAAMRKNGVVVFLDVSADEACKRLSGTRDRPLLNGVNRRASIEYLMEKRRPFYRKADLAVETTGATVEEAVNAIIAAVRGWR